jgi:hypothetical protein
VQRYDGNSRVSRLSCADQFRAMVFAQLTWRESLRGMEASLFWAPLLSTKTAIKLHRLRDLRGAIPIIIHVSDGNLHDLNVLDMAWPTCHARGGLPAQPAGFALSDDTIRITSRPRRPDRITATDTRTAARSRNALVR